MNIPYVFKKCTCCGKWLVASTVNFNRGKSYKHGLMAQCKECRSKKHKAINNPPNTDSNITKVCTTCGKEFPATEEYFYKQKAGKYGVANRCKECTKRHIKQYYQTNGNKKLEYNKQWNRDNKDRVAKNHKRWYQDNREKDLERQKRWKQTPQGQVATFNAINKRRSREQGQGDGITKDQWLEMMSFFNWECAYSGETLTKDTRSIDHIVPLNSNGDNMVWNCVPMLRSLNCSKHDKNMLEWYREQDFYSEARLAKIYEWQEYARKKWEK